MQADVYERAYSNFRRQRCIPNESTGDRGHPNKTVDNRIKVAGQSRPRK